MEERKTENERNKDHEKIILERLLKEGRPWKKGNGRKKATEERLWIKLWKEDRLWMKKVMEGRKAMEEKCEIKKGYFRKLWKKATDYIK